MKISIVRAGIGIAALLFAVVPLEAQMQGARRGEMQGPVQMRGMPGERIEQFKKVRMLEALKLDEETSVRFISRYNKHQEEMKDLEQQRRELLGQLRALRQSNASNTDLEKALADLRSLQDKLIQARQRYIDDLKQVLTSRQIADYVIFEENFVQNLRDIMRDMQRERMDRRF